MQLIVQEPPDSLRLFVDKLWYISADHFDQQDLGLPILQHELIFNTSDHFSVYQDQESNTPVIENKPNWISGLYTKPQRSSTWGRHETFGAFLKPWALQALTRIPASELTNQVVPGDTVFRRTMVTIDEQVRNETSPVAKLKLLERFLSNRFADQDIPAYVIYAVEYLLQRHWHDGMIRDLTRELRISPKSLTAAFNKHIGISPGRFLRIHLLHNIVTDLAQHPNQSLTSLAHRHHFFDQAHFNHHFKTLTNLTPGEYRNQVLAGCIDPASPCYIRADGL
ncbi:helix-turn-helix domain-containing protein [Larkinella harenae]